MTDRRSTSDPPLRTAQRGFRPTPTELLLAGAIVLVGFALRCAVPARMAVEHFDEGVYASNLWFDAESGYQYPERHLYAPPLLPALLEGTMILLGPSHWGTMLPGVLFGGLTVGLLWWVARSWFVPEVGLAAALLAATSDVHILYSRTALTDVPLCFWLLLAVYLAWEALRRADVRWAVAAGIATGLAWWTKYNGWLPLAIVLAALVPRLWTGRLRLSAPRLVFTWLIVTVTALVVWFPVWIGLQQHGGYAVVAANHRQYLVGVSGWWGSLLQQYGNLRSLDGWLSCGGLGMAILTPTLLPPLRHRFTWNAPGNFVLVLIGAALCAAGMAAAITSSAVLCTAAVLGITGHLLRQRSASQTGERRPDNSPAGWLLAAWFFGLFLATPFYRAYPRLTLPWLMSAWLGTGLAIGWFWRGLANRPEPQTARAGLRGPAVLLMLIGGAGIAWFGNRQARNGLPAWQDRTGMETITAQMVGDIRQDISSGNEQSRPAGSTADFVVYVYGEPALFFHLRAAGALAGPVSHLKFADPSAPALGVPVYLAVGPHALRSPKFTEDWTRYKDRFRLVTEFQYRPSTLVALNNDPPDRLAEDNGRPVEPVRLYRLKPAQPLRGL